MNRLSLPLGALLAALALPALAAPWYTLSAEDQGYRMHYATQTDDTGQYAFGVSCIEGRDGYDLLVLTPEQWEDTTSYAPEVPTTMTFDGTPHPNIQFGFMNATGRVSLAYRSESFEGELGQLLDALRGASMFELSYFDKRLNFSGEGSTAAIASITAACGL